jgi:RNA recognition motif-containing protein
MQSTKLFVGNLSHCVTAAEETEQLRQLFAGYGDVEGVNIIKGKRYGFVEMSSRSEAEKARKELNEHEFNGCSLKVNKVRASGRRQGYGHRRP